MTELNDNFEYETTDNHGILTLKKFRELTANLHEETQIVIDDEADWWRNVRLVGLPDADPDAFRSPYSAISLAPGVPIDSRQF